jgi:predicted nuclease with TOPRIM domain
MTAATVEFAHVRGSREVEVMPSDEQISRKIEQLEEERELLRRDESTTHASVAGDAQRLKEIRVELDRLWDLQRRRRALRDAGMDPDGAEERSGETVEGYWQ